MKIRWLFISLVLIFVLASNGRSQDVAPPRTTKLRVPITEGWRFRQAGGTAWYPATVPGCVHTDLMDNKLIDDPFYRDNEQNLQWIGKTDWVYETTFVVTPDLLNHNHVDLVFEGLDTYANVFLNDKPLLDADNMFRSWRVDCKKLLKTTNVLVIHFRSPINEVLPLLAKLSVHLPAPNDQGEGTSPYTRKATYQFGWDWGPRLVTSGIWKPVTLEAWDEARIVDFHIVQNDLNQQAAQLTAEVEIYSSGTSRATVLVQRLPGFSIIARQAVQLLAGANHVTLRFGIERPKFWWPNGMGAQPLYRFRVQLIAGRQLLDQGTVRIGLRTLELRQRPDQWGKSFEFIINGVPIFAKGANWIPADSFPSRITKARYRFLIKSARDSNMNMLRVWGGGIYESDDFYDLCDEMGILVWQDFMFAGSLYPANDKFLENVRHEAIDNLTRLRDHPSIVIWVGNNEIETAWTHWGWKERLPPRLWDDYKKIFHDLLPTICAEMDPSRPYWPSSPSSNLEADPDSQKIGDVHYWGVWHAALPFTEYEKQEPRFMSEYGFQSFPELETVESYTQPEDRDIQSPVMLAHQKHPRGNQLIREYMLRQYRQPKDFASFLYVSQVLQAEGIKIGAEHLRRIQPHNMGSLYWQLDDCWPVASWSSIDYFGRWKALQYYARRFYSELLISPHEEDGRIQIFIVSDQRRAARATLRISVEDFAGRTISQTTNNINITPMESKIYASLPVAEVLHNQDPRNLFLHCEVLVAGRLVASNNLFFAAPKELLLQTPKITTTLKPSATGFTITVSSDRFAKDVYLSLRGVPGFFSNNFFDLAPGQNAEIHFTPTHPIALAEMKRNLTVRSLADAF